MPLAIRRKMDREDGTAILPRTLSQHEESSVTPVPFWRDTPNLFSLWAYVGCTAAQNQRFIRGIAPLFDVIGLGLALLGFGPGEITQISLFGLCYLVWLWHVFSFSSCSMRRIKSALISFCCLISNWQRSSISHCSLVTASPFRVLR